jgi:hypothetical protein
MKKTDRAATKPIKRTCITSTPCYGLQDTLAR